MAQVKDIMEIAQHLQDIQSKTDKAVTSALLATSTYARGEALRNASKNFTGRNGRTVGGTLMNKIFSSLEKSGGKYNDMVLGVKSLVYARIHEYGSKGLPSGVIKPVNAKHLWVPNYHVTNRITPRDFVSAMRNNNDFFIKNKVAFYAPKDSKQLTPLFFLKDKVKIPSRPYLTPAMQKSVTKFSDYIKQFMR